MVIGTPPCALSFALQNLIKGQPGGDERYQRLVGDARAHVEFCIKLTCEQLRRGPYFLHGHPATATSWMLQCMEAPMRSHKANTVTSRMCRFRFRVGG